MFGCIENGGTGQQEARGTLYFLEINIESWSSEAEILWHIIKYDWYSFGILFSMIDITQWVYEINIVVATIL